MLPIAFGSSELQCVRTAAAVAKGASASILSSMGVVKSIAAKNSPRFLTRGQVAEVLGLSVKTLDKWALLGIGPRFRRLGSRAVRYAPADVERYIESAATGGGNPDPPAA